MEVLDAPAPESGNNPLLGSGAVRELPYAAWVNIQTGCDNSCAFCIVPSVRGPEASRTLDDIVAEVELLARSGVTEVTLLGQNVNSYGRDITKRRPLFAELLRQVGAVEGIGRVRFTSPHPKDLRPETIEAMAETPEVCEQLHLPLQSGSDRVLRAMRRGYTSARYLERLAAARAAIADLAVTTDIIVGFPGETEDDFEATLALCAEAGYDGAFTFIFSPRPGTRAADMESSFVPQDVIAERFERLKTVVDRSALARHQARIGRSEEALVEGVSRRDASMLTGRTRQGKLIHFPARDDGGDAGTGRVGPGDGDGRPPAPPLRPPGGGGGTAPASRADPGGERLTAVALVGVTASGKSETALQLARRRGDCEIVSVDSMCVYRGMDIGTSKPGPEARAAVPHHLLDLVDPDEDFTLTQFQQAAREALEGIARRGHHALLVGGTGLYLRAVVDDFAIPGRYPEVAAALEAELDEGRAGPADLHARFRALDPVAAARMEPTNRRRVVRALEVTVGSGRPFSTYGPGLEAYPASGTAQVGLSVAPEEVDARIEARFGRMVADGLVDEVRALAARPAGMSRTARQALGYREVLAHVEGGAPWPSAWRRRYSTPASSPGARPRGSAVTRGSAGPGPARRPRPCSRKPWPCTAERHQLREWGDAGDKARRGGQRLPGRAGPRRRHQVLGGPGAPAGRPAPGHRGRRHHQGRARS